MRRSKREKEKEREKEEAIKRWHCTVNLSRVDKKVTYPLMNNVIKLMGIFMSQKRRKIKRFPRMKFAVWSNKAK